MSFDLVNFKSNPNFKFKEYVKEKSECLASTCQFDCYKDEGETFLISPYFDIGNIPKREHHISVINLRTNEVKYTLNEHKDRILNARYFQDPYTKKHYLISSDRKGHVIVWDLSDNGKIIYDETFKYESFIYSVLLFFEENNIIYAVISTLGSGETWVVNINEKDKKVQLKNSKDLNVYFLTYWFDESKKEHNIISCAKNKIVIDEYKSGAQKEFKTDDKHQYNLAGIVIKKDDGKKNYLITSATYGLIKVIDLDTKAELYNYTYDEVFFYCFVKWNDQYVLLNDCLQRRILVLDINDKFNIKSKVLCPKMYFDRFMKKVDHPLYGESILTVGIDWKIKLFINRNIRREVESK